MNSIDWIGTLGVFQILLAYLLNLSQKIKTSDWLFIILNCTGAGMACLASVLLDYLPFIILEGVWTLVSLMSLVKKLVIKLS